MAASPALPFRIFRRSLLDTRWATRSSLRRITTVQHAATSESVPESLLRLRAHPIPTRELPTTAKPTSTPSIPKRKRRDRPQAPLPASNAPRAAPPQPESLLQDDQIDPSIYKLLPLLKSQPPYYLRTHIHGKPYLVTQGDTVRLPFLMHGVSQGDILRLNRASLLGSRDYTLKAGAPREAGKMAYIDERLFTCRARVMGVEMEPLRVKEKTKRRQRHVKHVKSKHRYTVLRIMEITVNEPPVEGDAEKLAKDSA
ncbi:uncharacterized protein PV09_07559 [Verruconis gallopava]|uniref:Large ribosomal subunit protein bL21m n=1 Tax=Verruconis gallopava TaxID=253628 RepID=A0A0D2A3Q3_9PEZI|nr:uncharacterized protein PV09_07559 [Verruconis gallopava]KIW01045.1 hypothetical protein PV09_07559 [Verruconis gallopava]